MRQQAIDVYFHELRREPRSQPNAELHLSPDLYVPKSRTQIQQNNAIPSWHFISGSHLASNNGSLRAHEEVLTQNPVNATCSRQSDIKTKNKVPPLSRREKFR